MTSTPAPSLAALERELEDWRDRRSQCRYIDDARLSQQREAEADKRIKAIEEQIARIRETM